MPLVGRCLNPLWFGATEDYVLEGAGASLQDRDQPGRLEPDGAERRDRRPAESVAQFAPAPQVVRSQSAGPGDVVVQADLVLDPVAGEDVLYDKCQVPDAQLVSELLGELAG